jgi:L-ascorbate metabolism protein UlaG (beta-lactamase superfamily)
MRSFITNPQLHIAALRNPAMMGGPFINYDASRVPAVRTLMETTAREQADMVSFAEAVKELDRILRSECSGYSLEQVYPKIPEALRGYVELVYDLNNNASFRFVEGLLYMSPYYKESSQSMALSLVDRDGARPFIFSTPRLHEDGRVHLNAPFRHEGLDELFKMKETPQPYGYIKEALGVADADDEVFSTFFTEQEQPPPPAPYTGDDVRIRYFGHACILIESRGTSILSDPVISYDYAANVSRYTFSDLPEQIDYVFLTHNHQDHLMFETLLQLRHRIKTIIVPKSGGSMADPSIKLLLQTVGFGNVREIDEMETIRIEGGSITGVPFFGEHADLNIRTKMAFLVKIRDKVVMCAADSNNIEPKLYEHVHRAIGDVDVLFLGMECEGAPLTWMYGPLLTKPMARAMEQSRRLDGSNYAKGIDVVNKLKPRQVYVYAMGQEPWLTFLTSLHYTKESPPIVESDMLVKDCSGRGITGERLYCRKEIFL